jgi:hypothetical protein
LQRCTGEARNGNQSTKVKYKSTPLLIGDQAYMMPATVHTCHLDGISLVLLVFVVLCMVVR